MLNNGIKTTALNKYVFTNIDISNKNKLYVVHYNSKITNFTFKLVNFNNNSDKKLISNQTYLTWLVYLFEIIEWIVQNCFKYVRINNGSTAQLNIKKDKWNALLNSFYIEHSKKVNN